VWLKYLFADFQCRGMNHISSGMAIQTTFFHPHTVLYQSIEGGEGDYNV